MSEYLKEIEIVTEGNQGSEVVLVGHYNIATWCSSSDSKAHRFKVNNKVEPGTSSRGILFITLVSDSKRCIVNIPIDMNRPCGEYSTCEDEELLDTIYYRDSTYRLVCTEDCSCTVLLQVNSRCDITTSSDMSSVAVPLEKKQPSAIILTKDIHYGDTFPNDAKEGQLFFVCIDDQETSK